MALTTVRVPDALETLFSRAEKLVAGFFRERRDQPEQGTIEIFGERYLLVRAASLSVEFFDLVRELYGRSRESEADDFARNILFDLAHVVGKKDALNLQEKMNLHDPLERLSAGPVHFSHAGWAFVDISPESRPTPGDDYYLLYDHPYSFESDAWLRAGRTATFPVCIMNAGYSSGWCEQAFGMPLVSAEVLCRGRGDAACRFIMAPPNRIEQHVARFADALAPSARPAAFQIPDFFARKRIEEDLRRRFADEMAERERAEKKLRQSQKLEAVGRLAGGIAHDFNNLMATVVTRAALLERKLAPDDAIRAELHQIIAAGERAATLTRQLLQFSRAQVLDREPLEVNKIVAELAELLDSLIGEHVVLDLQLDRGAGWILADRGQVEQVITNLVVNGRDAMKGGGVLTVASGRRTVRGRADLPDGDYATIVITDHGEGMSEETLAHVFEPFFTTRNGETAGMGLATVYGIVAQSGGHIDVASELGRGSTFTVLLPRISAPPAIAPAEEPPRRTAGPAATLLLVEDNDAVRGAIAEYLRDEGFSVYEAHDAETALTIARDNTLVFDLLVTDVVMPGSNGRELALSLRNERPGLRVLFMSGYSPDRTLLDGMADAELIAKPFHPDALIARVRELLG